MFCVFYYYKLKMSRQLGLQQLPRMCRQPMLIRNQVGRLLGERCDSCVQLAAHQAGESGRIDNTKSVDATDAESTIEHSWEGPERGA